MLWHAECGLLEPFCAAFQDEFQIRLMPVETGCLGGRGWHGGWQEGPHWVAESPAARPRGCSGCTSSRSARAWTGIPLAQAVASPAESGYFRSDWRTTGASLAHGYIAHLRWRLGAWH
jgi:hypothetical protein